MGQTAFCAPQCDSRCTCIDKDAQEAEHLSSGHLAKLGEALCDEVRDRPGRLHLDVSGYVIDRVEDGPLLVSGLVVDMDDMQVNDVTEVATALSPRNTRRRRWVIPSDGGASMEGMNSLNSVAIPEPFTLSVVVETFSKKDFLTAHALENTLKIIGVDTNGWGKGNTKAVYKFWKEMEGDEAGLEVWQKVDGEKVPVRVTHVLRAKVSSQECYDRHIFLFNTWQQFGDGRKRTRNGLLSEKLTTAEMPLTAHLKEVCTRAVTREEMQCVRDSLFKIWPDTPAPEWDPDDLCPLEVEECNLIDHTVEIEASKSYPGLVTVYHLYTVDIVCAGLPKVDFNTLEFEDSDKQGKRKLKYVYAWVWLQWSEIQRYLLEGSVMKEQKKKGSFRTTAELEQWLGVFDLDLEEWGCGAWKPVSDLFNEVQREETQLEHWGRQDGVPLLMRVCHVIQLKVTSQEMRLQNKFLFQEVVTNADGRTKTVNRPMAAKMSTALLPFDEGRFKKAATDLISTQLAYVADLHFQLRPDKLPKTEDLEPLAVEVVSVEFSDHRTALEDSPSFKDITTMYHLYTVEVECEGLPVADFASVVRSGESVQAVRWKWVTWQQSLDILHARVQQLERKDYKRAQDIHRLNETMQALIKTPMANDPAVVDVRRALLQLQSSASEVDNVQSEARVLPLTMVSELKDRKLVSDRFEAKVRAVVRARAGVLAKANSFRNGG